MSRIEIKMRVKLMLESKSFCLIFNLGENRNKNLVEAEIKHPLSL